MSRKSLETLLEEAVAAQNKSALKTLTKEKKRRREAKNKSRRKSYHKKVKAEKKAKEKDEKKKQRVLSYKPKTNSFHIIITNHGKRLDDIFQTSSEIEVNYRFKELLDKSKTVDFPVRFNAYNRGLEESEYEILIIRKKTDDNEYSSLIRDEFGNFIDYQTNNDTWVIYDRAEYSIEETFWVYGYNPLQQRKTYKWILSYLLSLRDKKYVKFIYLFYNKLIIDCNGSLDMVICKNKQDSARLYNFLLRDLEKEKVKNVTFMGKIEDSVHKRDWAIRLSIFTGWNHRKVLRQCTQDKKKS